MLLGLLGARVARADDWATPGLDPAHTRSSAERSGAAFGDGSWTATAPGWTLASPVVEDGFLVTADSEGVVSALRADTGEPVWTVSLGSNVQATPAIARGRVFVPTVGNTLFALRLVDGATLWTRNIGGMTYASPATLDGDIIVAPGLPQTNAMRLSGETGEIVWQTPAVMWQFSNTSPAVGGGLAVFGSQQGHYYAFDAATGALRWQYVADGIVNQAAPIIVGGRV
jgi:outer membrane protein assembly factor BamB